MKFRIFMATATAASVLMTVGAMAANTSYISQSGDLNTANVDQTVGDDNNVGTLTNKAVQNGDRNDLDAVQSGNSDLGTVGGVNQTNDRNIIDTTQKNGLVQTVTQTGVDGALGTSNKLTISQGDNFAVLAIATNKVGSVTQTYEGAGGSDYNRVSIEQNMVSGLVTSNHLNQIGSVTQTGINNRLTASQDGGWNSISTILQDGVFNQANIEQGGAADQHNFTNNALQRGDGNVLDLLLTGSSNGVEMSGAPRTFAGNHSASIVQDGNDNSAGIAISGDLNGYAIKQNGDSNIADGIVITGNSNQLGIGQYNGDLNVITLATISGDGNSIALRQGSQAYATFGNSNRITGTGFGSNGIVQIDQQGSSNKSTFSQSGNANSLIIEAKGNSNTLNSTQTGGSNAATVKVDGNSNFVAASQNYTTGAGNSITVDIFGNSNNASGSFSGDAASAAGSLTRGQLNQDGGGNTLTVKVGSLSADADSNRFAFGQNGAGNNISAEINGSLNQVVVTQIGTSNVSYTLQTGGSNNIGVQQ